MEFFPEENFQKWPIYPSRTFSAVSRRRPQGSSSSGFDGEGLMRFYLSLCFCLICEKKKKKKCRLWGIVENKKALNVYLS